MANPGVVLFLLSLTTILISTARSHNITAILNSFPNYSLYNLYLTQAKVADRVNSRETVTNLRDGKVTFNSAAPSSKLIADYTKSVKKMPYIISVLEMSALITFPDLLEKSSDYTVTNANLLAAPQAPFSTSAWKSNSQQAAGLSTADPAPSF